MTSKKTRPYTAPLPPSTPTMSFLSCVFSLSSSPLPRTTRLHNPLRQSSHRSLARPRTPWSTSSGSTSTATTTRVENVFRFSSCRVAILLRLNHLRVEEQEVEGHDRKRSVLRANFQTGPFRTSYDGICGQDNAVAKNWRKVKYCR